MLGEGGDRVRMFEFLRTPGQLQMKKRARLACGEHASVQLRKVVKAKDLMGCEHVTHVFFISCVGEKKLAGVIMPVIHCSVENRKKSRDVNGRNL